MLDESAQIASEFGLPRVGNRVREPKSNMVCGFTKHDDLSGWLIGKDQDHSGRSYSRAYLWATSEIHNNVVVGSMVCYAKDESATLADDSADGACDGPM